MSPTSPYREVEAIIQRIKRKFPHLMLKQYQEASLFGEENITGAIFSEENPAAYRYLLWRLWDPQLPILLVIMLNPSTADERIDDRTIKTLIRRCKVSGHGGFIVTNLFAWRSPHPSEMKQASDPVGPHNDEILDIVLTQEHLDLLCAWGADGDYLGREEQIKCKLKNRQKKPLVLKISKGGQPEHPLYKKESEPWFPWEKLSNNGSQEI